MFSTLGLVIVGVSLILLVIYRRFRRRRSTLAFALLASLPILANGAAKGQWSAALALVGAIGALVYLQRQATPRGGKGDREPGLLQGTRRG